MHKSFLFFLLIVSSLICVPAYPSKIENGYRFRSLIIGLDGTKGKQFYERVFLQNKAPHFKIIADHGQYAACTNSNDPQCAHIHLGPRFDSSFEWVTSPGWAAVLTGVNTDKSLIKGNDFDAQAVFYETAKNFPTFLLELKNQGFITAAGGVGAFVSSMNNANTFPELSPGITDYECGIDTKNKQSSVPTSADKSCNLNYRKSFDGEDSKRDAKLTKWLLTLINKEDATSPDVLMGVYDTIDGAGHRYGYSSNDGYLNAISTVDSYVAQLANTISQRVSNKKEVWLIMITADHGGHVNVDGRGGHDRVRYEDEAIPLIVAIFGKNISLLQNGKILDLKANQMDVSPSVLHWFDMKPIYSDGTIRSIYQR